MEGMRQWQEWLDQEQDTGIDAICSVLGSLFGGMPTAPLARAIRIAAQAAARRIAAMRATVAGAISKQQELQRKAVAWGEKAAQQAAL